MPKCESAVFSSFRHSINENKAARDKSSVHFTENNEVLQKDFVLFLKENTFAHQGYIYLIKNCEI